MSPTSTIQPRHVACPTEWPALSPSKISSHDPHVTDNDWEFVADDNPTQTSFERDAEVIVEPLRKEMENSNTRGGNSTSKDNSTQGNSLCVKHYPSTPDFRHYDPILEEGYGDVEGVLMESYNEDENEDGVGSLASSSIVMVSGPPSVNSSQSVWSSKISFRDAILKEQTQETKDEENLQQQQAKSPRAMKKKPKFVVKAIRRCSKSTGDLQSLARIAENEDHYGGGGGGGGGDPYNEDLIMGETDAQLYYNQKAQGKLGRKNGRKVRPDEAKRLQITMAKKDDQRQRQQAAAKKR